MFRDRPVEVRAALGMLTDSGDLLRCLLNGGKSKVAGRLAGELRSIGRAALADQVRDTMRAADYTMTETDPFAEPSPVLFAGRPLSPYVGHIHLIVGRNALAARGYWQTFQPVKAAVDLVLDGRNAGEIADRAHPKWYRESFGPSVAASPEDRRPRRLSKRGGVHTPLAARTAADGSSARSNAGTLRAAGR